MIVSGSVGLEPILQQAGLSAQANIFSPFELKPWSEDTAIECLAALSRGYNLDISEEVMVDMCRRLRCCVPHHVQQFFSHLHEHLRRENRVQATLDDVETVYKQDLLSVRGQIYLDHYETRLKMVLGDAGYQTAINLLTEATVNEDSLLTHDIVELYRNDPSAASGDHELSVPEILYTLSNTTGICSPTPMAAASHPVCSKTGGGRGTLNSSPPSPNDRFSPNAMPSSMKKYNPGFLTDEELIESFCVRTSDLDSLIETLRETSEDSSSAHSIVIGPRGSGKDPPVANGGRAYTARPQLCGDCSPSCSPRKPTRSPRVESSGLSAWVI